MYKCIHIYIFEFYNKPVSKDINGTGKYPAWQAVLHLLK